MYKIYIGIVLINLFISTIYASNPSSCEIEDVSINWDLSYYKNVEINDTAVNTVIANWTFTSNLKNISYEEEYVDITIVGNQLVFKTNDDFENFDKDHTDTKHVISMSFNIYLECDNDQYSSLTFEQPVRDTNNHAPTFQEDGYTYKIPMPILPKYMITNFGDSIIVEDLDFSNTNITFTINPAGNFEIVTESLGNKQYEAKIIVTQAIKYNQTTQFTLTATDNGEPTLSNKTTLTIEVDEEASIPDPPQFNCSNYNFEYTVDGDQAKLTATDGDIKIVTESDDTLKFELTPELDGLEYSFNATTNIVTLTLKSALSNLKNHTIVLTLTVSNDVDTTSATILINIPDDLLEVKFSSYYYGATYTVNDGGTDTIEMSDTISVTPTSGVTIAVIGDYKDNFAISNADNQWTLSVIKDLSSSVLKNDIVVELQATITDTSTTAVGLVVVSSASSNSGGSDDGDCNCDDTAYIVVIVILAILLIGGLIGGGVFYYLRRRPGLRYKDMNVTSGVTNLENRYAKNTKLSESRKFDPPPARRPTGLTQFPPLDDADEFGENNVDFDEPARRKSVIFDDTVEELQIEAKNNDINDEPITQI